MGYGEADATEQLDPLGDLIDEIGLLIVMFVEQQMKLIERGAGGLP
jgi:hypothetical protein